MTIVDGILLYIVIYLFTGILIAMALANLYEGDDPLGDRDIAIIVLMWPKFALDFSIVTIEHAWMAWRMRHGTLVLDDGDAPLGPDEECHMFVMETDDGIVMTAHVHDTSKAHAHMRAIAAAKDHLRKIGVDPDQMVPEEVG